MSVDRLSDVADDMPAPVKRVTAFDDEVMTDDERQKMAKLSPEKREEMELIKARAKELATRQKDPWQVEQSDLEPAGPYVYQKQVQLARAPYRRHTRDTGSPEFQIASYTARIKYLTEHMKLNRKDFASRRGLVGLVNKRRRMLKYLGRTKPDIYKTVLETLGLRPVILPGTVESQQRKVKYAQFKNVKKYKRTLADKRKKEEEKERMRLEFEFREERRRERARLASARDERQFEMEGAAMED
ncbi:unnamed protein product [Vitrella brassicaformis CCMP3155]|uniref:Ribosomal protein S15 n=1 Tax=Vitrella brassicaformis (strain CCMP3155) TaxID=1169540 RepID=A0A0G4FE44_VITBC|nr:unnamed protein product [Vitrella brassicaformis CCMP3155]|eukprot:CEM11235.1 unnamed protein product [Vitrella brassicaformis CCMP3155]